MKRTHRFISFFLILALIAVPVLPVTAAGASPVIEAVAEAANIKKCGNVVLSTTCEELMDAGFAYGDVLEVRFLDRTLALPLCGNYSDVDSGEAGIFARAEDTNVVLAVNMGDFATSYGITVKTENADQTIVWNYAEGVEGPLVFRISLREAGGYYEEYVMRQLSYSDARGDYPALTDVQFANFRAVTTTGMGGVLYRSSSPLDPEHNRNSYADAALRSAGVTVVMNLADAAETVQSYESYADSYYASVDSIALGMGKEIGLSDAELSMLMDNLSANKSAAQAQSPEKILAAMTTEEKVAQMVMPAFSYDTDENGENHGMAELTADAAMAADNDGEIDLSQEGIRIGVGNGTVQELLVMHQFPEAELLYYDKLNGYAAVAQGKIDAYIYDKKQMELAVANGLQGVRILDQTLGEPTKIAVGISKMSSIPDLENQVNRFIRQSKQDGTLDDMYDRWVNRGDFQMPEIVGAAFPQYHLVVGTTGDVEPYSFFEGGTVTGYDIELAYRFAAWLGADVEIQIFNWDGIVPAVQAGKADLIASNLQVSTERAEELLFSDTLYEEENGIMVRDMGASANAQASGQVRWQDYNGKRIGVLVGPLMEDAAAEFFPDSEYLLFNSYPDCTAALLAGKIDGFLGDEPGMISMHAENPEIDYIHESLTENNYAFAFRKDDPESAALCAELDAFLAKSWADGTMEELGEIWLGVDESRKDVDMSGLTGENGTIRVVTTSTDMPWSYIKDGKNVGYDIDLVVRFCRERGYALELGDVDCAGRIPAVQSGKYNFTTDMNVTPERTEQVLFSDPTAHGGIVLAVLASDLGLPASGKEGSAGDSGSSFLDSVKASFEKTFLRESRWKLFLEGIGTTLLITVLSILFGTALGFGVYMLCRNGNPVANTLTRFFIWLIQGMPVVVLLMILYYIIFAKSSIDGTAVAVIGFTLVFGAAVYGMLRSGVGAVPKGQTEAAYALGYGNARTFFRIILPQAVPHFLPAYKGEIVALIKATAIVGYIAVQDLTKMGDIVRGRTYEAFFPLIAVAVIYFVLAAILTFLVGKIEISINPRRRRKEDILKGVVTHD